MKKKLIFGITLFVGMLSIFLYENIDFFNKIKGNIAGISQYGSGNYAASELLFSGAQIDPSDAILEYNTANSLYKQGENTNNMQDKVDYFQKALAVYSGSLNIKYDSDTQDNMIFVENILKDLQETSQEEQEEGDSEQESEEIADNEGGKGEEGEENDQSNTQESGDSGEGADSKEDQTKLSDEQKAQIEKYAEQLKRSEFYNQKYFNKKPQEINTDINELLRDPFLEDGFVRGGEKDW